MLEAIDVSKTYPGGVRALQEVNLRVDRGETVVLVGESGCGKTTLLRLFNRMEKPSSGEIRVGGVSTAAVDPISLRRATGYVPQDGGLLPHWPVGRNVALVPSLLGWPESRRRNRADELLDLVGLPPQSYRDRYPRELSGGQRQRVAFARALAADPEVVLLDEPFGALDALTRRELQREYLRIKGRLSKTMLLVTHDLEEAFHLADRVAVLRVGRVLQIDTPLNLSQYPADAYVEALLELGGGGSIR